MRGARLTHLAPQHVLLLLSFQLLRSLSLKGLKSSRLYPIPLGCPSDVDHFAQAPALVTIVCLVVCQDRTKSGRVSKVQWANGLNLVLQLDVPFLSYVVSDARANQIKLDAVVETAAVCMVANPFPLLLEETCTRSAWSVLCSPRDYFVLVVHPPSCC